MTQKPTRIPCGCLTVLLTMGLLACAGDDQLNGNPDGGDDADTAADSGRDAGPDATADSDRPDAAVDGDAADALSDGDEPADSGPDGADADPDTPPGPLQVQQDVRNGTRLQAEWHQLEDGSRTFAGWHDTELGLECLFRTASDGTLRCLPGYNAAVPHVSSLYADASCTQHIGTRSVTCDAPTFLVESVPACPRHTVVYESAGAHAGRVYAQTSTGCQEAHVGSTEMYRAGNEIPTASFVLGSYANELEAGGLYAKFVEGSDGSRRFINFFDVAGGFDCQFRLTGPASAHCLPLDHARRSGFSDAGCSVPVLSNAGCDTPRIGFDHAETSCDGIVTPLSVGAHLNQHVYYQAGSEGSCHEVRSTPPADLYASGPPVDLSAFVAAQAFSNDGPGRITQTRIANEHFEYRFGWFDSQRGEACTPRTAMDGTLRCLPLRISGNANTYFSDPDCTAPLCQPMEQPCPPPAPVVAAFDPTCPGRSALYEVGDPATPSRLFFGGGADCVELSYVGDGYFHQGRELAPATFALFHRVRDE